MKKIIYIIFILLLVSCDRLLEVPLADNETKDEAAIVDEGDVQELLNSAYDVLANYSNGTIQRFSELLADDIDSRFTDANGFLKEVYNRNTNFFNSDVNGVYSNIYITIYRANATLEAIEDLGLNGESATRMIAEARFLRGVAHFDAVRLFAAPSVFPADDSHLGIPIRIVTGIQPVPRSTVAEVYAQIISDLEFAEQNLPTNNGNYANVDAASGYLAKVYFQRNDFTNAAAKAGEVIGAARNKYVLQNNVNARFSSIISREVIFSTVSTTTLNDNRASTLIGSYRNDLQEPFLKISEAAYDDGRQNGITDKRNVWFSEYISPTGAEYYVINKYNVQIMNVPLLHYAEMLLIRAESLGELDQDLTTAIGDINAIRARAGLSARSTSSTAQQVITYAREERRIELALEGDRYYDLRRRGALGEDITIRNAPWDCPGLTLQFPAVEGSPNFVFNEQGGCND